jgi:hypothetical protein
MNDQPNDPVLDEDPGLDRALRDLTRFNPRQGFAERVVARVRVPLPGWARRIRDWFQSTFSGVTGWTVFATFSLATAAAWGTAVVAGVRYGDEVTGRYSLSSGEALEVARRTAVETVVRPAVDVLAGVERWAAAAGLPVRALALGYVILALVSAVVLWLLMAEPGRARGTINVVR